MRTHMAFGATGVVALLVTGGSLMGCSSGGDDAAETPIGQALTEKFLQEGGVTTEEQARCVAGGIVGGVGEDRIEELGFTPDNVDMIEGADFTDDEIDTMVDAYFDCVDVRQVIVANLAADVGDETADCVAENLPENAPPPSMRAIADWVAPIRRASALDSGAQSHRQCLVILSLTVSTKSSALSLTPSTNSLTSPAFSSALPSFFRSSSPVRSPTACFTLPLT